jgi:hypothetical protein
MNLKKNKYGRKNKNTSYGYKIFKTKKNKKEE